MNPVRGGGSASALTITNWSALATTTRSSRPSAVVSSSSAVRRSTERRSAIRTMRARAPSAPDVSPTRLTRSPTTTDLRPSSRARIAVTVGSSAPTTPRRLGQHAGVAAAVDGDDEAVHGVGVLGRVRVRGRDDFPGGPGRRPRRTPAAWSPGPVLCSRQLLPVTIADHSAGNSGMVLEVHATSSSSMPGDGEPDHRGGVRHPVVVRRCGTSPPRSGRGRISSPSGVLGDVRAEPRRTRAPARRSGRSRGPGCARRR